ncbi:hypothetical protein LTR64_002978 [Lithohypha guttulata]|uniref:Uncharacterized protein n=1 Tax=Lithohypha guttulata TaxID=1690604 RepID=A0AAN7YB35_9EURO|nr:hypothetical protein LTR51_000798 [Lithohypha guttulata]KAK5085981.1 hypothetical protein LTR05_005271 [Lithohypha guttulata]
MAEDAQLQTLQQRIAALNADHLGRLPGKTTQTRPKPPIPDRRPILKHKSFNIPNENAVSTSSDPANLPNGPPQRQPPPLPARRTKQEADQEIGTIERDDNCSRPQATATRTKSEQNSSRIKAPAWGQCDLPTLLLKTEPLHTRKESVVERPSTARTPSVSSLASTTTTAASSISHSTIPPPLPSRKSTDSTSVSAARRLPPLATAKDLDRVRKASFANVETVELAESPPPLPVRRPSRIPAEQAVHGLEGVDPPKKPPPVPRASRPDLAAIQATKPKLNSSVQALTPAATATGCMS